MILSRAIWTVKWIDCVLRYTHHKFSGCPAQLMNSQITPNLDNLITKILGAHKVDSCGNIFEKCFLK